MYAYVNKFGSKPIFLQEAQFYIGILINFLSKYEINFIEGRNSKTSNYTEDVPHKIDQVVFDFDISTRFYIISNHNKKNIFLFY